MLDEPFFWTGTAADPGCRIDQGQPFHKGILISDHYLIMYSRCHKNWMLRHGKLEAVKLIRFMKLIASDDH
jgi:hypothetical protein